MGILQVVTARRARDRAGAPARFLLAATVLVVLGTAGCGGDTDDGAGDADAGSDPGSSGPTTSSAPAGPAWGEDIEVQVGTTMSVQEPQAGASGRIDVLVEATNDFLSEQEIDLFLACTGNYNTGTIVVDGSTPTPTLTSGTVPADTTVEGYVSLTLPTYQGAVVDSCTTDAVTLVVPGFAGQDAVYPLDAALAEHLLTAG